VTATGPRGKAKGRFANRPYFRIHHTGQFLRGARGKADPSRSLPLTKRTGSGWHVILSEAKNLHLAGADFVFW